MSSHIQGITMEGGQVKVKLDGPGSKEGALEYLKGLGAKKRKAIVGKLHPLERPQVSTKQYFLTPQGHRVNSIPSFRGTHEQQTRPSARAKSVATKYNKQHHAANEKRDKAPAVAEAKRKKAEVKAEQEARAALQKRVNEIAISVHEAGLPIHRNVPVLPGAGKKGKGIDSNQEGAGGSDNTMYDDQINTILAPVPGFQGCFASDEIPHVKISSSEDSSFVLNSDPASKKGTHWVAVWISPVKDKSVELFDSLFDMSPLPFKKVVDAIRKKVEALHLPYRLKFKYNEVRDQRANSSTCGWFATRFILDRARGQSFADATHFKSIQHAEGTLKPLEKEFKYL